MRALGVTSPLLSRRRLPAHAGSHHNSITVRIGLPSSPARRLPSVLRASLRYGARGVGGLLGHSRAAERTPAGRARSGGAR